ncbi:MAG TPA: hypothetical protein VMB49_22660 [Acidobacteriaceae bacterium]|nr:hypothetical protein [Acidobacteriaceae bacterium]
MKEVLLDARELTLFGILRGHVEVANQSFTQGLSVETSIEIDYVYR